MFAFVHSHFNLVHHVFFTHSFYRIAQRPRLAGLQRSSRAAGKCARFLSWVPSVGAFAYSRERNELSNRKVRQGHRRVTPPTWQPKPYKTSFSPIFFFFSKRSVYVAHSQNLVAEGVEMWFGEAASSAFRFLCIRLEKSASYTEHSLCILCE